MCPKFVWWAAAARKVMTPCLLLWSAVHVFTTIMVTTLGSHREFYHTWDSKTGAATPPCMVYAKAVALQLPAVDDRQIRSKTTFVLSFCPLASSSFSKFMLTKSRHHYQRWETSKPTNPQKSKHQGVPTAARWEVRYPNLSRGKARTTGTGCEKDTKM